MFVAESFRVTKWSCRPLHSPVLVKSFVTMQRRLISDRILYPFHPSLYTVSDPAGPRGGKEDEIDYRVVIELLENDQIWAERGKAIQSYAMLEQALSRLLSHLSDTTELISATIFYKIASSAARSAIIEKLLRQKYSSKFNLFWNQYLRLLRPIDLKRNEIVHWVGAAIARFDQNGTIVCGTVLIPPNVHSFFLRWNISVKITLGASRRNAMSLRGSAIYFGECLAAITIN